MTFEFTKNYKFTILNNENVWAKAMNRVVNENGPGRQGGRRDDRAHQAGRGLTYGRRVVPSCATRIGAGRVRRFRCGSARATRRQHAHVHDRTSRRRAGAVRARPKSACRPWQTWGADPASRRTSLVFLVFVLYPVGYGLWLARHPASYVKLVRRPDLRARRSSTRSCSWSSRINLKMVVALFLSGFFVHGAHVDQVAVAAVHPAVGGAVDSRPSCRSASC